MIKIIAVWASLFTVNLFFVSVSGFSIFGSSSDDRDVYRNASEIIRSEGYPEEDHVVPTKDGFLLTLQRIPCGRKCLQKTPVLLVHGLFDSSDSFIINLANQSLAYILADSGYDVWLGNCRTNKYSKKHTKYTTDMAEYWDYSFDEIALYDLPAMITYTLKVAGKRQLNYIGFSQGTTACFAMLSERPDLNKKIKLFVALAPVVFTRNMKLPSFLLGSHMDFLNSHITPKNALFSLADPSSPIRRSCSTILKSLCLDFLSMTGAKPYYFNESRLPVYVSKYPDCSSTKAAAHFNQLAMSNTFAQFDYGKKENFKRYKQSSPPEYRLDAMTTPTVLMWSSGDVLAAPEDVRRLREVLNCVVEDFRVPFDEFTHGDFVLGYKSKDLLYNDVVRVLRSY